MKLINRVTGVLAIWLALCAVDAAHAQPTPPGGSGGSYLPLDSWSFSDNAGIKNIQFILTK